jgi:hypothetical protein
LRLGRRRLGLGLGALPLAGALPGGEGGEFAYVLTWHARGLGGAEAERLLAADAFPGGPLRVWGPSPEVLEGRMAAWRAADPLVDRAMADEGRWAVLGPIP